MSRGQGKGSDRTPRQQEWARSACFRALGSANMTEFNKRQWAGPKCGAMTKRSGEPCGNPAMENGRCRIHGGKTPRGDQWHRPQWPDAQAPDAMAKLNRKLVDRERAAKARQRKLARMTPEERAAHEEWQRTHKPGSAAQRAAAKREREQNAELRRISALPPNPPSPELVELRQAIADAEARLEELRNSTPDTGAFS